SDVERFSRTGDRERQKSFGGSAARARDAVHQPRLDVTHVSKRDLWKEQIAGEQLAGRLRPAGREGSLKRGDRRSLESHIGLAPLVLVMPVTEPVVGEPE